MRELVYYVATSIDGYIAGPAGQFDAFVFEGDHAAAQLERFPDAIPTDAAAHLGIDQTTGRFSTVLMGWNTYAVGGLDSPYRHLEQIVFSRTRTATAENLRTTDADPRDVIRDLRTQPGGDIWLCGGGDLAAHLVDEIDRIIIKRQPVLFRSGIPLFGRSDYAPLHLDVVESTTFDTGVTITEYARAR